MRVRRILATMIFGVLSACQSDKPSAPPTVGSVSVSNASGTLQYGQSAQLTASVVSTSGAVLTGRPLTWASSNDAIASVSSTGLVTAGAVRGGSAEIATITVTSEGKSANAAVTVAPIPAATVTLSLAQFSMFVGQTTALAVTTRDVTGGTLTGRAVTWSSASPNIATVNNQGLVTAVAAGTATITATVEGKSTTATVTVALVPVATVAITPAVGNLFVGQTAQLSASARDSAGNVLTGRAVTWSSAAPRVATVSASGLVTAVTAGTATITATVEGKTASAVATTRAPAITVAINGAGSVAMQNLTAGRVDTLRANGTVTFAIGDSLRAIPIETTQSLLDAIGGVVTDSVQLQPSYDFKTQGDAALTVTFVPRLRSAKALQNAFFDTTVLNYRTSENFVVWWDKRWDHNHIAKDALRQLEAVRTKGVSWGMPQPRNADRFLINSYLHHKSGENGPNIDVFDDGWGQSVGTDRFGMPYYAFPMSVNRVAINYTKDSPYCWCYGSVWHEGFHLAQYGSGQRTPPVFPYAGDQGWYIEATADWMEKYHTLGPANTSLGFGVFSGTPAFLMQPQLRLWSPPGSPLWSVGVHAYAAHLFFLYLTWNGIIPEDFIGRSFASGSSLTPQEYLYRNIPDFPGVYRRFAEQIVTLDGIPSWATRNIADAIQYWRTNGARSGNALPNGQNADNTYAFDLTDAGTAGWVGPSALLEAWAFSVSKITATTAATYRISLRTSSVGSRGTPSDLSVRLVTVANGVRTYSVLPLSGNEGSRDVTLPAGATAYVVVVSTPLTFTGAETFDYSINIVRNP